MIYVYIYSILLHIMYIFTNRFLVLSESKADIRNPLSYLKINISTAIADVLFSRNLKQNPKKNYFILI